MATWDLLFVFAGCWEREKSGDLNKTGRLVCVRGKVKTNYAFSITLGPTGKASEIALCLGTFYHWKNTAAISSKDLTKERDEGKRGWGMRGFSFTVDHRWCLDHLTNSYHFILSKPSSLCLSLLISPQCTCSLLSWKKKKKKGKVAECHNTHASFSFFSSHF